MSNLILTARLSIPTGKSVMPLASTILHEFPARKVLSPGIAQAASTKLLEFLKVAEKPDLKVPAEFEILRKLQAEELLSLAKLVESGERIVDSIVYEQIGQQTIVLTVKPAEKKAI